MRKFLLYRENAYDKIDFEKIKDNRVYHPTLREQRRARDGIHATTQYRQCLRYTMVIIKELRFLFNRLCAVLLSFLYIF